MSEQERMDQLLRQTMATTPAPRLSSDFDQQLTRRLRPRRLDSGGRGVMIAYAVVALTVSIWAMRSQSMDWTLIAIAIVVPLIVAAAVQQRQRTRTSRGRTLQGH